MTDISFFHIGSNNLLATESVVKNIRSFHPKNPYFLSSDNAINFMDVAVPNNTSYTHFSKSLGGPKQPYGYEIDSVMEFLDRFKQACYSSYAINKVEHMMMVEDDVWLVNPITVNPDWQMACHNITIGNEIPPPVIDDIEKFSGKKPNNIHYGGGGGSIYNARTFLENYDDVTKWFKENGDRIMKQQYPTFGYIDCFMVVYFYLCGKKYSVNPHLTDTHNHAPGFDYDAFVNNLPKDIQIVNNYKRFYWK